METRYSLDDQFVASVTKLTPIASHRVMKAIEKFRNAPDTPGLNLEQLEGRAGKRRLWTIRASQELRVLLARDGPTWVFLRAGHHDEVYDLADRRTFVVLETVSFCSATRIPATCSTKRSTTWTKKWLEDEARMN